MNALTLKQNLTYLVVAVILFGVLYYFKPQATFVPRGIVLPLVETPLTPTQERVTVYQVAPITYQQLATINVEAHTLKPTKVEEQMVLAYAKSLAQRAGANGLLIKAFGFEGPNRQTPAPLSKLVFFATAIRT